MFERLEGLLQEANEVLQRYKLEIGLPEPGAACEE
jgi:hypothetical protein